MVMIAALSACARPGPPAPGESFTGEVLAWNAEAGTITLRRGLETVRVKAPPEEFSGLRLRETATVRGTLAPPGDIERVVIPAPRDYAVLPRGPVDVAEVTGRLATIDVGGVAAVDTPHGSLLVWTSPGETPLRPGQDVRLRLRVQTIEVVARERAAAAGAAPAAPEPSTFVGSEPGDYSVVTGHILRITPSGVISVESPRGPVDVWLADVTRYRVGDMVQVSTSLNALR
jgi:hypothetical protein